MHPKTEILYINLLEKKHENCEERRKFLVLSVAPALYVTIHKISKRSPIRREWPRGNEPPPISMADLNNQK